MWNTDIPTTLAAQLGRLAPHCVAFGEGDGFLALAFDRTQDPAELQRLFNAPACESRDANGLYRHTYTITFWKD